MMSILTLTQTCLIQMWEQEGNVMFIIHGVINSVIRGDDECIDIQIYDLVQAFDALWLDDCLNDVFDATSEKKRNLSV